MTALTTAAVGLLCLLIGITLSAVSICAFLLHRAAASLRDQTHRQHQLMTNQLTRNSAEIHQLQLEVSAGFSKMDASQIRETTIALQRIQKNLASTTAMLYRLVLTQPGAGDVVEDVLGQDIPLPDESASDVLSSSRAQAMINDIQRRAGMTPEPGPVQQAPLDIGDAWAADEGEYR